MEEYANEKIAENPKVETEEEQVERVVVNFVEQEEISSSKDIDVVDNSLKESHETILEEEECKYAPLETLGVTEDGENENDLSAEKDDRSVPLVDESESVVEVSIENSKDSEVSEEIGEKVSSLDEINGIASNVKDVVLQSESQVVSSETDEIKALPSEEKNDLSSIVTDVDVEGIEEKNLSSLDENCEPTPSLTDVVSKETDEKTLPSLDENVALSSVLVDVRSKGIEEENMLPSAEKSEEHSAENVEDSSNQVTSSPAIGSSDGFTESVGNTPIISLRQRTVQRTSWRSCCGLFEVLRRTDR